VGSKKHNKTTCLYKGKETLFKKEMNKVIGWCPIRPSSTDKNIEIVMSDVITGVRILTPQLYVCEFTMTLPFYLST